MAASNVPMAATSSKLSSKADALYRKLERGPLSAVFTQSDLLAFDVADVNELVPLCQELCDAHLLQMLELERSVCWRRRPRELAERLRALPEQRDPMIVYTTIESMSTTGIWIKSLKSRTGIPQANLTKVLKLLESRSLVKQVKSSKHPGRKVFMLAGLDPGEDITGGPWFTDGELDVTLVEAVAEIIRHFVRERSWREGPKVPSSIVQGLKSGDPNIARAHPDLRLVEISDNKRLHVPRAPDSEVDLPTLADIHTNIEATGVVRKELTEDDVLQILDMMVYDGQIERHGPREQVGVAALIPPEEDEDNNEDEAEDEDTQGPRNGNLKAKARKRGDDLVATRKLKRTQTSHTDTGADGDADTQQMAIESESDASQGSQDGSPSTHARPRARSSSSHAKTTYHYIPRPISSDIEALPPPYRAHLSAHGLGTGFSTTPCARCPAFRLCEAGGPVDAAGCAYLGAWLDEPTLTNEQDEVEVDARGRKKVHAMVVLGEGGKRVKIEEQPPAIPVGGAAVQ